MTSSWARAQDRKRNLIAAGATAALYCLAFLIIVLAGILLPSTLPIAQGPLVVDLGGPQGAVSSVPLGVPAAPERPVGQPPSPPAPATPSATRSSVPPAAAPPPPPSAARSGSSAVTAPPRPGGTMPPAQGGIATGAPPNASALPGQPPSSSRTFSSSSGTAAQGAASGAPGAVGSPAGVVSGSGTGTEMGNAYSTTYVAAPGGKVGQNLFEPIWMYMPPPNQVSDTIYNSIPAVEFGNFKVSADARKEAFKKYYVQSGDIWTLIRPVKVEERSFLWAMLKDAGYNPAKADFKAGKNLHPVTIEFVVEPAPASSHGSQAQAPKLIYTNLVSSSGSKEIDDAVVYGFKQATFFNNTGTSISGHFTYDFNGAQSVR